MKLVTQKVYQCEYCKRIMLSASSMSRHEKFCKSKPENRHKCFDECKHLERSREVIPGKDPFSRYSYRTVFHCKVMNQSMYSYLIEKSTFFKPSFVEGLVRMPTSCVKHTYMNESELAERFGNKDDDD